MKLPLLLSVPHAGLSVPPEVEKINRLTPEEIVADGDSGAREIYSLEEHVEGFVTTDIARAFIDMNRAEDDVRKDGVVKTHTCWDVPIYEKALNEATTDLLISKYHRPYHDALAEWSSKGLLLGIDCHTMAAKGPPVGPDVGEDRPAICLSNADGTCPDAWVHSLADILSCEFGRPVSLNKPFLGGHIIRTHSANMPWIQLEHSRAPYVSNETKRILTLGALEKWCSLQTQKRDRS